MLTEYFVANRKERLNPLTEAELKGGPPITDLIYKDVPKYYTWNTARYWKRRTAPPKSTCVGRISYANPHDKDRYFLRRLLHYVKGAESYRAMRTIDEVVCKRVIYFSFFLLLFCRNMKLMHRRV